MAGPNVHPPDWQLGMYAEDALDERERPGVDAHLVGCQSCRRRIVALEDEARLLRSVLQGEPADVVQVQPPAQGFTWGLPLAVLLVAGLGSVISTVFETRLPGAGWLRPSRVLGVNEMFFDVLFAMRDNAPGLLEFGVSMAALVGLGALGAFVAGVLLRRVGGVATLALLGLVAGLGATPADAAVDLRLDQDVRIGPDERLAASLVASGDTLVIEGVVEGDVVCFTERTSIRGRVEGNVFGGGRELEITGVVTGTVVYGSELSRVTGTVEGSAYLGADHISIGDDGTIGGNLTAGGERVHVEGSVGRDLVSFAENLELRGKVSRDATFWGRSASIVGDAEIDGNLLAHVEEPERLVVASTARIAGTTEAKRLEPPHPNPLERYTSAHFYFWIIISFVAAFLVGLAMHAIVPRVFEGAVPSGREFFGQLGIGFAFLLLVPIALVLMALTLVGIPAALIGASAYAICLYAAKIVVAALIGRSMLGPDDGSLRDFGLALLAGLALLVVLRNLPFIGGIVGFVVLCVGLGLLAGRAQALLRDRRAFAA